MEPAPRLAMTFSTTSPVTPGISTDIPYCVNISAASNPVNPDSKERMVSLWPKKLSACSSEIESPDQPPIEYVEPSMLIFFTEKKDNLDLAVVEPSAGGFEIY